ncbi:MAG TPA: carboxypeptidase-like regulatory domain-containing protein [Terriglobales bacterium]|nr:carboxypeptidase-like regulatory domain-containing protein [Terriglobales bacterium]
MKNAVVAAASFFLFASMATAECVEVTSGGQPSFQNLRITTIADSKALSGIKLDVYQVQTKKYSLMSDKDGVAILPKLDPGEYGIFAASTDTGLHGQLYLQVSKSSKGQTSSFFINMTGRPLPVASYPPPPAAGITAPGDKPVTHIQYFSGILVDQSGAPIPDANIVVSTIPSKGASETIELKSAADGKFSAPLAEGKYVAMFRSMGFRNEVVIFEIGKDADKTLQITLRVASC